MRTSTILVMLNFCRQVKSAFLKMAEIVNDGKITRSMTKHPEYKNIKLYRVTPQYFFN